MVYISRLVPAIVLLLTAFAGCAIQEQPPQLDTLPSIPAANLPTPAPQFVTITGADGKSEITVPGGWSAETDLNKEAQIQVSDRQRKLFLIVLAENKSGLKDMTRQKHSEVTRNLLSKNLNQAKVSGPTEVTQVNGNPALQYTINGSLNNISVEFLHTTVETSTRFIQLLAWTPPSTFQQSEVELQKIVQSFREK
jgi:hypothetical protein